MLKLKFTKKGQKKLTFSSLFCKLFKNSFKLISDFDFRLDCLVSVDLGDESGVVFIFLSEFFLRKDFLKNKLFSLPLVLKTLSWLRFITTALFEGLEGLAGGGGDRTLSKLFVVVVFFEPEKLII